MLPASPGLFPVGDPIVTWIIIGQMPGTIDLRAPVSQGGLFQRDFVLRGRGPIGMLVSLPGGGLVVLVMTLALMTEIGD
jgi:hypothetical protein